MLLSVCDHTSFCPSGYSGPDTTTVGFEYLYIGISEMK